MFLSILKMKKKKTSRILTNTLKSWYPSICVKCYIADKIVLLTIA